jgi:hypothetical protein
MIFLKHVLKQLNKKIMRKLTNHHRKCRANGGSDDNGNISMVTDRKHKAWHVLFGCKEPHKIVWELNNVWMDPAFKLVIVENEQEDPNQLKLPL